MNLLTQCAESQHNDVREGLGGGGNNVFALLVSLKTAELSMKTFEGDGVVVFSG